MLGEIVAAAPLNYVYQVVPTPRGELAGCVYVHEGQPSCLIGHLLHNLGVTVPPGDQDLPIDVLHDSRQYLRGLFTLPAVAYLAAVQRNQDAGVSWSHCLVMADRGRIPVAIDRSVDDGAEETL